MYECTTVPQNFYQLHLFNQCHHILKFRLVYCTVIGCKKCTFVVPAYASTSVLQKELRRSKLEPRVSGSFSFGFEHILKGGSIDCGGKSLSGLSRFCFLACLSPAAAVPCYCTQLHFDQITSGDNYNSQEQCICLCRSNNLVTK